MANFVNYQTQNPATPPANTKIKTTLDGTNGNVQHVALDDSATVPLVSTRANTGVRALNVAIGPTDPISDVPVFTLFEHHQIHEGESHEYNNLTASLASGSNKDFRINVPDTLANTVTACPHFVLEIVTTAEAEIYLYEGMTYAANNGGTERTPYNRNRTSTTVPKTKIYEDPTPATTGTNIYIGLSGAGVRVGGADRAQTEWVFKSNTDYLFRITSRAASNKILARFLWYEDLGV